MGGCILLEYAGNVGGRVLAVGVHEHQDLATGGAGATLDRRAIAHGVGGAQHGGAVFGGDLGGGVGGAVIHHDQLGAGDRIAQRRQGLAQAVGLVSFRKANKREVRQYENAK